MDYEKKYDDALAKARVLYERLCSESLKDDLAGIFPELRESEDERIRKAVVSLVYEMKGTYQSFAKVELDQMVAWLEKQKEQKTAWSEEDEKMLTDISWAIRYCAYDDKKKKRVHDWFINRLESLRPPFKPSEEQMSSLKQARDYYMSGGIKYVGRHLSEIAEQLEKL